MRTYLFQMIAIWWHSKRTPFLCHLLRMWTTKNGHLYKERSFKPWWTSYTLACQKACCKVWSNLCPEESELHSFMAFAHTMYGMLGIVPINQSSGALRKTRNKLAMTLKPISGVRGCQWYLSFVTKWWTSGDLSTESLLIEQSCGPSSGATLLIYLWNRISTIYCEEVCQHTTTTQRVGIMETKYTLTRTANPWQQILCTNWHRC